jgi:hypothetical protein
MKSRTTNPKDAGTIGFDLRIFKVIGKNGAIGNLCLHDETTRNTVFFRKFSELENITREMMRGK